MPWARTVYLNSIEAALTRDKGKFPVLRLPWHWIWRVWLENLVHVCANIPVVVCKKVRFQGTENLDCILLDYDVMWVLYVVNWCFRGHDCCLHSRWSRSLWNVDNHLQNYLTYNLEIHSTHLLWSAEYQIHDIVTFWSSSICS